MSSPVSIEVMILWGKNPLRVDYMPSPRPYSIGEHEPGEAPCDYVLPRSLVGARRARLLFEREGRTYLLLLPRAKGTLAVPPETAKRFSDLVLDGRARRSTEVWGAYEIELPRRSVAWMRLSGSSLVLQIRADVACEPLRRGRLFPIDAAAASSFGTSLLLHACIVSTLALFMPRQVPNDTEGGGDDIALIQRLLGASGADNEGDSGNARHDDTAGDTGFGEPLLGKNEHKTLGRPRAPAASLRLAVAGPSDNADPHIAREAGLREAARFGMIGLLATGIKGMDGDLGPTAPWGRADAAGTDPESASGRMWGDAIGDTFGTGGLGLSGTGEGTGARGEGIAIGDIGTLGHGSGTIGGRGFGYGYGRIGGGHTTRAPVLRCGGESLSLVSPGGCGLTVNGRLPPEVVQRVVRQNFGRFRLCYEDGLRTQPTLAGRVAVKFVIGRDGSVAAASDAASDLADPAVVSCVVRRFGDLSFPEPEGGLVTVVYPIVFSLAEGRS